jgi:hypothetical protein
MTARQAQSVLRLGLASGLVLLLVGCPRPTPTNQSPTADAGPDQTVAAGSTVTLNGSASSDPDGDPLTFEWRQTGGTPAATLSNANTPAASFTAPSQAATLTFQLTVDDGHGGTASDTVVVTVVTGAVPKPILYIANGGGSVSAYDITTPATVNGNVPPNANLAGGQTNLGRPADVVIDNDGDLLVVNNTGNSITAYANALNLGAINGNVAPIRNVQGLATLLVNPFTLAINRANDLLFVGFISGGTINVYAGASTAALNGNLAPVRSITSTDISGAFGIAFGSNDELYVANNGNNTVSVFANASNLNGTVAASRKLTSTAFVQVWDVFIDRNDTMYVVNGGPAGANHNQINVFANAAARNGAVMPDSILVVPGATFLTSITVDAAGNGYIADPNGNAVYGYDNIAARNGTIAPDRTLTGANTLLAGPLGVFVHE